MWDRNVLGLNRLGRSTGLLGIVVGPPQFPTPLQLSLVDVAQLLGRRNMPAADLDEIVVPGPTGGVGECECRRSIRGDADDGDRFEQRTEAKSRGQAAS